MLLLLTTFFAASAFAQESSPHQKVPDIVWTWSKQCDGKNKLVIAVQLKSKTLYRGIIPVCLGKREDEDRRVAFRFSGKYLFQDRYRTRSKDAIEGDIWQAGGESDALILGISLDNKKQILLNTLHIAKPDKQTSSQLNKGLWISTRPILDR